jgi:hypothetical protein
VQRTGDFRYHVARAITKHPNSVLHNSATLDATVDMFDPHTSARNLLIFGFLLVG